MKPSDVARSKTTTSPGLFRAEMFRRVVKRRPADVGSLVAKSWREAETLVPQVQATMLEAVQAPGILGEAASYQLQGQAKRIRARLAVASGKALGADMAAVVKIAAATELLHEASLVHDDLQDRDTLRRGRKTVWFAYSDELAITLGDWFINQAYDVMLSVEGPAVTTRHLARAMAKAVGDTVRGQALENDAKASLNTTQSDYIDLAGGKTAPLLALPLEAVALVAGCGATERNAIRAGLECLGSAYQLRDDLIDLLGEKGRGEAGADLIEGKATLPVLIHYRNAGESERNALRRFLESPRDIREQEASAWARTLVESPAFDEVRDTVDGLMSLGFDALADAPEAMTLLVKRVFGKLIAPVQRECAQHSELRHAAAG